MRLNKFLAASGVASRRDCDEIIKKRQVTVNGKIAEVGIDVNQDDEVCLNGEIITLKTNEY